MEPWPPWSPVLAKDLSEKSDGFPPLTSGPSPLWDAVRENKRTWTVEDLRTKSVKPNPSYNPLVPPITQITVHRFRFSTSSAKCVFTRSVVIATGGYLPPLSARRRRHVSHPSIRLSVDRSGTHNEHVLSLWVIVVTAVTHLPSSSCNIRRRSTPRKRGRGDDLIAQSRRAARAPGSIVRGLPDPFPPS